MEGKGAIVHLRFSNDSLNIFINSSSSNLSFFRHFPLIFRKLFFELLSFNPNFDLAKGEERERFLGVSNVLDENEISEWKRAL